MTDLFAEVFEERAAIHEYEAGLPRDTAERMAYKSSEALRHQCEVSNLVDRYHKYGKEHIKDLLAQIEKHRGKEAAEKLRTDALKALGR